MADPRYDFEPGSEEALAAARAPVAPPSEFQRASAEAAPNSSEMTQEDYLRLMDPRVLNAPVDVAAAEASVINDELAQAEALKQDAMKSQAALQGSSPDMAQENAAVGAGLYGSASENLQKKVVTRSPRPGYGPNKAALEKEGKLISEVPKLQGNVQEAELGQAMMQSDLLQAEADKQQELHAEMIGRQQAQAAREQAVRQKVFETQDVVQKSVAEAAKASDIDPDRAWGEKGIGAKIAAVIAAGLLGWAGMDPFAHINSVIQNSLDAQKYNRDQKRAQVGIATNAANAQLSAYDQIRAQIGDEQVADEAYRLRSLQVIYAQAEAKLADAGVTVLSEKQKLFMNGLEQQITEQMRRVGVATEANTPYVTSVRPALSGLAAKLEYEKGKTGLGMMAQGAEQAVSETGQNQRQTNAAQIDIAKEERAAAARGGEAPPEERRIDTLIRNTYRQQAGPLVEELRQIGEFRKMYPSGEIPGYSSLSSFSGVELTEEQRKAQRLLVRIVMKRLRPESGAAISEREIDRESGGLIDGKQSDTASWIHEAKELLKHSNENDVWSIIDEREAEAQAGLDWAGRGVPERIINEMHGQEGPRPRPAPVPYGTRGGSVVTKDQQ